MLYEYQKAGVDAILSYSGHAYLADEMGLGKTAQALTVMDIRGGPSLVIAPAATLQGWNREAERLGLPPFDLFTVGAPSTRCLCSWSRAAKLWGRTRDRGWNTLVTDETHYAKDYKSARTKAVLGDWYGSSRRRGLVDNAKFWLPMSGTPMPNRPKELRPLLGAVYARTGCKELRVATDFKAYGRRFCDMQIEWRAGRKIHNVNGASNLKELSYLLRNRCHLIRRLKSDVLRELPPITRTLVNTGAGPVYSGNLEEIAETIANGERDDGSGKLLEWRKAIAVAKVPSIKAYVQELLEETPEDRGIVVFMYHRDATYQIAKELGTDFAVTGDTAPDARQAMVDAFAAGRGRVFVANYQCVGIGINGLQERSDVCVFGEIPWVPGEISQAIARLHRIGQKGNVQAHFLASNGLDGYILRAMLRKERTVGEVIQ